jgi:hypothetical protein
MHSIWRSCNARRTGLGGHLDSEESRSVKEFWDLYWVPIVLIALMVGGMLLIGFVNGWA